MQKYTYVSSIKFNQEIPGNCQTPLLLLDIETTGLSPDMSTIFMIGCGYYVDNRFHTIQWLADSLELASEQDVLSAFSFWLKDYCSSYKVINILTYNGQVFDLPFLEARYQQCKLENPINSEKILTTDLYREFLPFKTLWPISNMKLKNLSTWIGHQHPKVPEGRQLIKSYHNYIKTKDPAILNLLFLHNIDDLESLDSILSIYHYLNLFKGDYTIFDIHIHRDSNMILYLKPNYCLPASMNYSAYDYHIKFGKNMIKLTIPIYEQGLRYYYTDYKNYVYLINEDHALPKSMAKYIDKNHWQKANQENCYTWFFPDESFIENKVRQKEYVQMVFRLFGFLR